MKKMMSMLVVSLFCFGLLGCSAMNKTQIGATVGAGVGLATGMFLGNTTTGNILSTATGAVVGGVIGKSMDDKEASSH